MMAVIERMCSLHFKWVRERTRQRLRQSGTKPEYPYPLEEMRVSTSEARATKVDNLQGRVNRGGGQPVHLPNDDDAAANINEDGRDLQRDQGLFIPPPVDHALHFQEHEEHGRPPQSPVAAFDIDNGQNNYGDGDDDDFEEVNNDWAGFYEEADSTDLNNLRLSNRTKIRPTREQLAKGNWVAFRERGETVLGRITTIRNDGLNVRVQRLMEDWPGPYPDWTTLSGPVKQGGRDTKISQILCTVPADIKGLFSEEGNLHARFIADVDKALGGLIEDHNDNDDDHLVAARRGRVRRRGGDRGPGNEDDHDDGKSDYVEVHVVVENAPEEEVGSRGGAHQGRRKRRRA
jgi:hypothetical protein